MVAQLMRGGPWAVVLVVVWGGLNAAGQQREPSAVQDEPIESKPDTTIRLVAPSQAGGEALSKVLNTRRSMREFAPTPLTDVHLSQLVWAAQGVTSAAGFRTAPSAGALYPLELYVLNERGLYRYDPPRHQLQLRQVGDLRRPLHRAALSQPAILQAPVVFVITGVYGRTARKYGQLRAPRYVHLEAGHAAQNLLLQATALGLGAVPIGAFHDDNVRQLLRLPNHESPLYLIPVGNAR